MNIILNKLKELSHDYKNICEQRYKQNQHCGDCPLNIILFEFDSYDDYVQIMACNVLDRIDQLT